MRNVGVREISRITGFSPATVSNALNNKRGVNKDTAETIRRVAKELGYERAEITYASFLLESPERFSTRALSTPE